MDQFSPGAIRPQCFKEARTRSEAADALHRTTEKVVEPDDLFLQVSLVAGGFELPTLNIWLRGGDLNPRPLGYEPNELPDCSTPRH